MHKEAYILLALVIYLHMICFLKIKAESDTVGPMEENELKTLYSAIQDFVGKEWNGSELYPDPCGWTPIQGVSCDFFNGFWHVTVVSIGQVYENSLKCIPTAEFGHQIFQLKHLRKLTFSNCFFSTPQEQVKIPETEWEGLANTLEYLEFRSNPGLIGTIPSAFGSLRNLESLVLIENGLTGELPANIGQLAKLKRLVLSGNGFVGRFPDSFGGLNQLLILDASRNFLSGELPRSLGGLASLIKLDLSNNKISGTLPWEIGNLKNVTLLDLSYNNFSGGLVDSIQGMWSIQEMVLSNNPIAGTLTAIRWEDLQNLEVLDLSNTGLTGEIPNSMTKMKKLRFLGLGNNMLLGSIPQMLENLPCISALYINGNNFTGKLEFSGMFYQKMGSHFRASDNVDLCISGDFVTSRHVTVGVKLCE